MKLEEVVKTTKFRDEKHKAIINMMYTSYWMRTIMSKEMKSLGLTIEQFNIMRILKGRHPEQMCIKDIAERMIEKNSNVPRIIDRLILKKLAKRTTSKVDKRETLVFLTEKGILLLADALNLAVQFTNDYIGITEEEALTLNALLEKLRGRDDPQPTTVTDSEPE